MIANDQVDAIAREIRKYYIERKNALYDNRFKLKGRNAEFIHWQKAAEVCIEIGATPEVYVDAAFAQCRDKMGPFPNAMYGTGVRRWYSQYMANRRAYMAEKREAMEAGRDIMFDEEVSDTVDTLRSEYAFMQRTLLRLTGSHAINSDSMRYIKSLTTSFPSYIRVLAGYGDEDIKDMFGKEAYDFYVNRPSYYNAAQTLGFPIREILLWLNAPKS